jgi:hypothetical protein
MPSAKREIQKQLLILVVAILIVHSVAIALDRLYGFSSADPTTRKVFTTIWMLVSLVVVLVGLYRIRVARNAAARERR